jgi:spore maturation protein CgeB
MRILITGTHTSTTLAWEYGLALERLGCKIIRHFGVDEWFSRLPNQASRVVKRLAYRALCAVSNRDLLQIARDSKPDVVLLFKGADIFPDTIRELRKRHFFPVVYNPDHPFEFFSRGSGNSLIANAVPEYELYVTYSRHIERQLAERFPSLRTSVIPFGHSVDDATYRHLLDQAELSRICFVGNPDAHRVEQLSALVRAGLKVDIYGYGWDTFKQHLGDAGLCGPANGIDLYRSLYRYRVQLNFLRPHNAYSHNMRSFEAPACGAIMLAEDTPEHNEFFRNKLEAFYFTSTADLINQSHQILALDCTEAQLVRMRARSRSVFEPYSYSGRALQLLDAIQKAKTK